MEEQPVPDPGPDQILVKAKQPSVDPYMQGRMSPATNYTKGVGIGDWLRANFTLYQRRYDIVTSRNGT
jgi:NADPH-dependent curcumin reductase CurA